MVGLRKERINLSKNILENALNVCYPLRLPQKPFLFMYYSSFSFDIKCGNNKQK